MSLTITATYEDGVLKPSEQLDLAPHTKVRVTIEAEGETERKQREDAWISLEQIWRQTKADPRRTRSNREQLHERR